MQSFSVAMIGEVDAGKSTTLGQILLETFSLNENKISEAQKASRVKGGDFEPAFLLDAFEYERVHEMTVDVTSVTCQFADIEVKFLDTPGHRELSNKFIGGACHADLALLILDSTVSPNADHFRHARMLQQLGIRDFLVVLNKWDRSGSQAWPVYQKAIEQNILLSEAKIHAVVPVSAKLGSGIEELLKALRSSLVSIEKSKTSVCILMPVLNSPGSYWLRCEQGTWDASDLFDYQHQVRFSDVQKITERLARVQLEAGNPGSSGVSLLAESKDLLFLLRNFKASVVPLESHWTKATSLRTRWGNTGVSISGEQISLEMPMVFLKDDLRMNQFILEQNGKIVALGVPRETVSGNIASSEAEL
jgi:small GTP-binding protein